MDVEVEILSQTETLSILCHVRIHTKAKIELSWAIFYLTFLMKKLLSHFDKFKWGIRFQKLN